MSTFINRAMIGVIAVYPQFRKIILSAFVSCILYHHDTKVILYNCSLDCSGLLISVYFDVIRCPVRLFVIVNCPEVEDVGPMKGSP